MVESLLGLFIFGRIWLPELKNNKKQTYLKGVPISLGIWVSLIFYIMLYFRDALVQSLNSPFLPPHIPGRAKEESRITCMRMLRTTPFFPPQNRGKNHIWKYFPDLACGAIFWMTTIKQQFLHSDWLKTCQLIPNQWNFTSATLTHIRFVFLSQYQR